MRLLLHEIAVARDLHSINIAAGTAHEKLLDLMASATHNTDREEALKRAVA